MKKAFIPLITFLVILSGCNKDLEQFPAIPTPVYPTGTPLASAIAATPTDSLYSRIIIKSGLAATLNDQSKTFTMFVPDNNAVIASFGGSLAAANSVIASMSATTAAGIVQYNTIGQKFIASSFSSNFPNYPLPTQIVLDPNQPFVRMSIYPAKGTINSYVNNIPIVAVDQAVSNGVIHHVAGVVTPPSLNTLKVALSDPQYSLFRAAILRGDSGQVGTNRIDSALNTPLANLTVFAPNDAAFTLTYGISNPAVIAAMPVTSARGIVAYHVLGTRAFKVNFIGQNSATTLLGGSPFPPIGVSFSGSNLVLLGAANGGNSTNVTASDAHYLNGVLHQIDRALKPF